MYSVCIKKIIIYWWNITGYILSEVLSVKLIAYSDNTIIDILMWEIHDSSTKQPVYILFCYILLLHVLIS